MPEPGNATTPLGRSESSSSLRRKGAALPWASQSGLHTTWWTPFRSAHPAAIFSAPGPPPWTRTTSAYLALTLSRCAMIFPASLASLPPRDGDECSLREVGRVLAVLSGALEVARLDDGGGQLAGLRDV